MQEAVVPPLKWAGGKRWLVQKHGHLFPETFNRYFEPFFGSGAVFFHLQPSAAVVSDLNSELMNLYRVMRDRPNDLRRSLRNHEKRHDELYYYQLRASRPRSLLSRASRLIYLNRTCWNGLYRVNQKGEFNVPKGTKSKVLLETDDFEFASRVLSCAEIEVCDFEVTIDRSECGDFLFVDPPYTVKHNNNGFVKYNQKLFSWSDQIRLHSSLVRAVSRGVKVMVTNAAHEAIHDLYRDFDQVLLERATVIAGDRRARGTYGELVARWY